MNVLYSPRMPENTVGEWYECVLRPCYRFEKLKGSGVKLISVKIIE